MKKKRILFTAAMTLIFLCFPYIAGERLLNLFPLLRGIIGPGSAEAVMLDPLERALYYRRYIVYGAVSFNYDTQKFERTDNGSAYTGTLYSFTQNYDINLKSYVVHPAFLIYDVGLNWYTGTGTNDVAGQKKYSLNLDFFRRKQFSFSVRANYVDSDRYQGNQEGLTVTYERKRSAPAIASMRQWSMYNAMVRANKNNANNNANNNNNNANNSSNNNANNNVNNNEADGDDETEVTVGNNRGVAKLAEQARGSFLDRIMPMIYIFDLDRYYYASSIDDEKLTTYSAALRMQGDFITRTTRTNYFVDFGYLNFSNSGTMNTGTPDETRYTAALTVNSQIGKMDNFHLKLHYEDRQRDDSLNMKQTTVSAQYYGYLTLSKKLWNYQFSANYDSVESGAGYKLYSAFGRIGSSSDFGRVRTTYSLGVTSQYNDQQKVYDYALTATGTAGTMLTDKLALNAYVNIHADDAQAYNATLETRYSHSPSLQTYARYTFSKATSSYETSRYQLNAVRSGRTMHSWLLGLQGYLSGFSYTSTLEYSTSSNGEDASSITWQNTLSKVFFETVRFSLIGGVSRVKGSEYSAGLLTGPSSRTTTRLSVSSMLNMSPWKRTLLSLNTGYIRETGGAKTTNYFIRPAFSWSLRKLIISAEYSYEVEQTVEAERRDHRLSLRLTRPFMF